MSKEHISGTYDLVATTFDRVTPQFFCYSGRRLVELSQVSRGVGVLDVATGRGAVLFPASERVGRRGRVVGVDRSVGMVREVARDIGRKGLSWIRICQIDGDRLGFADSSFDFVFCGHAIYYFPQAAHEFHRILKPTGHVGVSIVAKGCFDWILEMFDHYLPQERSDVNEGQEVESIAINTVAGLKKILGEVGFEGIRVVQEETDFVYADEEAWWSVLRTMGVRWMLEKMDSGEVESLKAEMVDYLQAFKQSDGVHIRYRVLYAFGCKRVS